MTTTTPPLTPRSSQESQLIATAPASQETGVSPQLIRTRTLPATPESQGRLTQIVARALSSDSPHPSRLDRTWSLSPDDLDAYFPPSPELHESNDQVVPGSSNVIDGIRV